MQKHLRQQKLLDLLAEHGQAGIDELAAAFGVSDDTVRRDLAELHERGLLQKGRGGAVALDLSGMARHARAQVLPEAKRRIGAAAAASIPSGCVLMLDAGSTTLALATALAVPATVITHSLDIAHALDGRHGVRLILAGGEWDPRQRLFAGAATVEMMGRYRADLAVLGACAVHPRLGASATEEADARCKRAMLAASAEAWLLADHLKRDRCEAHAVAPLEHFQQIFTDRAWDGLDESLAGRVRVAGDTREAP